DLNGDGRPDLVAAYSGNRQAGTSGFSVLLANATGGLQPAVNTNVGTRVMRVTAADFNGDGRPDLAVLDTPQLPATGSVLVFLNTGNGAFRAGVTLPVGTEATAVATGDLNLDGRPDLVVACSTSSVGTY